MDRILEEQLIEGEIGLVIDYEPGRTKALDLLSGAMDLIQALDALDSVLLSSIDTELEPVSIVNDVQHSSLKIILARHLKRIPDEHLRSLNWKQWIGSILVNGKHKLLQILDEDSPAIGKALASLEAEHHSAPDRLFGYSAPSVADTRRAMLGVRRAVNSIAGSGVVVQSEAGDIQIAARAEPDNGANSALVYVVGATEFTNRGRERFKIKYPDMLGQAQWVVQRAGKYIRVDVLHHEWLEAFHARQYSLSPGDSIECTFEEVISYDPSGTEVGRKLSIIEVHQIIEPPQQQVIELRS